MPGDTKADRMTDLPSSTTEELLIELGRRFRLKFGQLSVVFHDGKPSPKVTVEHRVQRGLDET